MEVRVLSVVCFQGGMENLSLGPAAAAAASETPAGSSLSPHSCPAYSMDLTPLTNGLIEADKKQLSKAERKKLGAWRAPINQKDLSLTHTPLSVIYLTHSGRGVCQVWSRAAQAREAVQAGAARASRGAARGQHGDRRQAQEGRGARGALGRASPVR